MRLSGCTNTALWASLTALLACCSATPVLHLRTPIEATALLEETTRKSTSARRLRRSAGAEDDAPEDAAALKQQIADLEADKKGLVMAVRRLLKANQTEAQKKMLEALRGATIEAQEANKNLTDAETADRSEIATLQRQQKDTDAKLKRELLRSDSLAHKEVSETEAIAALHSQLAKEDAAVAFMRKRSEGASAQRDTLQAKVARLQAENGQLADERKGLEGTVQKLWSVNASIGQKAMLKMLDDEAEQLKVVDSARESDQIKFALEKGALSRKLTDSEHKDIEGSQAIKTLQGENSNLRSSMKKQSKEAAKLVADLRGEKKRLEDTLAKQKKAEAFESQAARKTEKDLQAKITQDAAEEHELQMANQKLFAESNWNMKMAVKSRTAKDADENIFATELKVLQKKVDDAEALVRQKEAEMKEVSSRGMKFYSQSWEKTQAAMQEKIKAAEKAKTSLEAQIAALSRKDGTEGGEIGRLTQEQFALRKQQEGEELRLTYAVDKENNEMLLVDKLEAENKNLTLALQSERQVEPRLTSLQKQDQALKNANLKLEATEKADRSEIEQLKAAAGQVVQKVLQERSKLNFAVDQENTQMLAVQILQGENTRLKQALQHHTDHEVDLKTAQEDGRAKAASIKALQSQNAKTDAQVNSLIKQLATLKHTNGELEDQYIAERSKLRSIADQDSTASLALKMLQGENEKLKQQLKTTAEDEEEIAKVARANEQRAASADAMEIDGSQMKRDLASLRQQVDLLKRKNDELQETIVSMAAKKRQDEVDEQMQVAAQKARHSVPQEDGLEKASGELSKLMSELHNNQRSEKAAIASAADDA